MTDRRYSTLVPHFSSRRQLLGGMAATVAIAACGDPGSSTPTGATGAGLRDPAAAVPLSRFGVDRFSRRDQQARLEAAFRAAHEDGFALVADPDADYRHDGPLMLDGVSFDGLGCTFTGLSDGHQVLRCIGRGWRVANLRVLGAATVRQSHNWHNGILVGDEANHPASDFVLENVTVDRVGPGRGVGGAGILFNSAGRGRIIRPTVRHSLSDGIHITSGSNNLTFDRPLSENTGDDGFAVVSYRQQGRICRDIRVSDGIVRDSAARGFVVVGGLDVTYERMLVERSAAAGAYLYGEGSFDTFGVQRCRIADPVLRGCSTGRTMPTGFSNAALIIGGRDGSDVVDGVTITRGAADCVVTNPVIEGAGRACTAAISTHQFAIRPRIVGARIRDMVSPGGPLQPNGLEIGGRDVAVDGVTMSGIAGLAIVILPTASGDCAVSGAEVAGSRTGPGTIHSFIYAEQAPALRRAVIRDGRFVGGPDRLAISQLAPDQLQLVGNRTR
jgi:hypothetical protein